MTFSYEQLTSFISLLKYHLIIFSLKKKLPSHHKIHLGQKSQFEIHGKTFYTNLYLIYIIPLSVTQFTSVVFYLKHPVTHLNLNNK